MVEREFDVVVGVVRDEHALVPREFRRRDDLRECCRLSFQTYQCDSNRVQLLQLEHEETCLLFVERRQQKEHATIRRQRC